MLEEIAFVCTQLNIHLPWFWPSLTIVFGAVFGSFLGCAIYRVPRKLSLWSPPSACPHCKNTLRLQDLIPLLSWVWYRGKCRMCHTPISPSYLWAESISIILATICFIAFGTHIHTPLSYAFLLSALFVYTLFKQHQKVAYKSVAFGLLCLVLFYVFS